MKMKSAFMAVAALTWLAACGQADDASHGHAEDAAEASAPALQNAQVENGLTLGDARVRPPLGGKDMTAGYFTIVSDEADALVSATSDLAAEIELHTHLMNDGVMQMRRVDSVELPAGEAVTFRPKGLHLMIFGVQPINDGETVTIELKFASGKSLEGRFLVGSPIVNAEKHDYH